MWPPQVTKSSQGQLALEIMLTEGLWIKEIPHTQKLFMTSFEPPSPQTIKGGNVQKPAAGPVWQRAAGSEAS